MTAYLTFADFREGTALWPDIVLSAQNAADARITSEIAAQQDEFDRLTRDHFAPETGVNLTFVGSGMALLLTPGYRLTAVTTVTTTAPDGSVTTLESTAFRVRKFGLERLDGGVWRTQDTVALTGTSHGWAALPYQVKRAVALMVYESIKGNKGRHHAVRWSTPDVDYETDPDSQTGIPEVDRIIKHFRVPSRIF